MKILKTLLTIIVILVAIIILGSFFLPQRSRVERSIIVRVPDSVAYHYVLAFDKFNEWNPWHEMEPSATTTLSGPQGQVGATYSWAGKEVGEGNFVVTKLTPYNQIEQQLNFIKPFESTASNIFTFVRQNDSTKVSWIYDGENKGIIDKWMGLMLDGMIGKDYEKGLQKLKSNLEK